MAAGFGLDGIAASSTEASRSDISPFFNFLAGGSRAYGRRAHLLALVGDVVQEAEKPGCALQMFGAMTIITASLIMKHS